MVNGVGGLPGPSSFNSLNSQPVQPQSVPQQQPAPQPAVVSGNGVIPASTAAAVISAVAPSMNRPLSKSTADFLNNFDKTNGSINSTLEELGIPQNSPMGWYITQKTLNQLI